jgi:metacaspase-1
MSFLNTSDSKCGLVIGINYEGKSGAELNGCINDTQRICDFLKTRCGYQDNNIQLLTDNTSIKPTKQNIINSIKTLVQRVKNTQSKEVWFSYSGHGSYLSGYGGSEESDSQDEALVPLDYDTQGLIRDDTLYEILVKQLPTDCNLFSIVDACHSGTALDLPYLYRIDTGITEQRSKENLANICKISGCRDSQTSADAYINGKYQGALTFSFLKCMDDLNYNFTPKQLIQRCKYYLNNNGYPQIPTLSFSSKDILDDIVMGDDNPILQQANICLLLEGDNWCNTESSWNILNLKSNKLLFSEDKIFYSRNERINYKLNLEDGRYILLLKDNYGDGGIKGNIKYISNGKIIKSYNFNKGSYQSIDFQVNSEQTINSNKKNIKLRINGDYYCQSESKWNIIDSIGNQVFSHDKTFDQSNQKTNINLDLEPGTYKLKCVDTYGDGGIEGDIYNESDEKQILKFKWNNLDWSQHNGYLNYYDFTI